MPPRNGIDLHRRPGNDNRVIGGVAGPQPLNEVVGEPRAARLGSRIRGRKDEHQKRYDENGRCTGE